MDIEAKNANRSIKFEELTFWQQCVIIAPLPLGVLPTFFGNQLRPLVSIHPAILIAVACLTLYGVIRLGKRLRKASEYGATMEQFFRGFTLTGLLMMTVSIVVIALLVSRPTVLSEV